MSKQINGKKSPQKDHKKDVKHSISNVKTNPSNKSTNLIGKFLDTIEKYGNALPNPVILFMFLGLFTILLSALLAGIQVSYETLDSGNVVIKTTEIKSLLTKEGIRFIFEKAISLFQNHPVIAVSLVAILGVGFAEKVGLLSAIIKSTVLRYPSSILTPVLVFLGIMSNISSDAGYIILIPLGGIIFLSAGRHPLAGIAATFAGVSAGFSANLLLSSTDVVLSSISTSASHLINENYTVNVTSNFYFMALSTILLVPIGWIITDKIVEPLLLKNHPIESKANFEKAHGENNFTLDALESRALKFSVLTFILLIIGFLLLILPENAVLRADDGKIIGNTPFINSIIFILFLLFFIPGIVYGFVAKKFKNISGIVPYMEESLKSSVTMIIIVFFSAQFVGYFNYSNLGIVLAVKGASLLTAIGFTGLPLMIAFIILSSIINLLIGSAVSKWLILAPIFVPMFMQLGMSPEYTQAAYRIGDSVTNIISPIMPYFPLIVVFAQRYAKTKDAHDIGTGTVMSIMLPYSIFFFIAWAALFIVFSIFNLPLGPNVPIYYVAS